MKRIKVLFLGRLEYERALRLQEKLLQLRQQEMINDFLLLVEHPPVLTIGKSGKKTHILTVPDGVKVYEVGRGGDVTYHGPGQIVGYPIMDLTGHGKDIHDYLRKVEETFIRLLQEEYQIKAGRIKNYTGVWVEEKKITAIGVAVKKWVTMHGFAFNVNTRLEDYTWIIPCGIQDKGVTSLQKILGRPLDMDGVRRQVVNFFCNIFTLQPEQVTQGDLWKVLSTAGLEEQAEKAMTGRKKNHDRPEARMVED